ncbi:MAG: NADH-quinone oxidoreductase subunit C [Chloroflexota bacterium]
MTQPLSGREVAARIGREIPGAVLLADGLGIWVRPGSVAQVARFLKEAPGLEMDYLNNLTAADYLDYIEVVYHLSSMKHNHSLAMKVQCWGPQEPEVPSVYSVWLGADLQERECYDMFGVRFVGHPNLKRLLFWEGFEGHVLRKEFTG